VEATATPPRAEVVVHRASQLEEQVLGVYFDVHGFMKDEHDSLPAGTPIPTWNPRNSPFQSKWRGLLKVDVIRSNKKFVYQVCWNLPSSSFCLLLLEAYHLLL